MHILYFSPRDCWPANTGARLRDYWLASHLARQSKLQYVGMRAPGGTVRESNGGGIRQELLSRDRSYSMPNLLRGLIGTEAITILNYTSDLAKLELAEILRRHRIDSVQIEGVHLSRYVGVIREVCPKARIIADWHNIESEIMWRYAESAAGRLRRLMARRTAPLIERAEQELLRKCDAHTVCSGKDRETLLRRCPAARIEVVPNGVDVEYYSAEPETRPVPLRDVLFVGTMDYHANVEAVIWFTRTVWPLVKASNPELVFRIVGRDPLPEIRALSAPDVVVTGTVDDIRPFYARAAATVVPLRVGGGTRLKILESMAAKVPVVSTRLGAEGIELRDGTDILLAESPAEIAQNLKSLIDDKALAERLRNHGHALVKRLYDWSVPGARLYAIHREIHSAGRGSFGTSTINS